MKKNQIVLFLFILSLYTQASEHICRIAGNNNLEIISQDSDIYSLLEVVEENKTRVDLFEGKISYGWASIGVGKAKIFLTVKDNQIVDLNVNAKVGILGINSEIKQKVTISRLKAGKSLKFEMEGGDKPTMIIKPSSNFKATGGEATIQIWNGKKYIEEKITIKLSNDSFKVYKGAVVKGNQISGLKINMRGSSLGSMHVGDYEIQTLGK